MKVGKGAILGLIGGLLGLVGVFLPWAVVSGTISGGGLTLNMNMSASGMCLAGVGSMSVNVEGLPAGTVLPSFACQGSGEGAVYGFGILAFSVLGLILVMLGKRVTSILALVFGLLVVVLAGVALVRASQAASSLADITIPGATVSLSVGIGYGIYLCIVGGILLLIGGVLAMGDAKKAMMAAPAPMPMTPPMPPPQ